MICCKITADFYNTNANFEEVLKSLGKYADLYWENNYLFLGETDTEFLTEKKIINILKKNGYTKFFVDIYSKDNQPNETDFINGWLTDKLMRINYITYEKTNQEMLKKTMEGLELLEKYVDQELEKQKQQEKEDGDSGTRRKGNKKEN